MSHCDAGVPVEVKIYLSQKIFQLFSKQVFSMFQDFEITLREKIFPTFRPIWVPVSQCDSKGRKAPLHVIREGGLSLFGSHGKGTGARVSHCDAGVPVEVKIYLSQKIFQLFSKQVSPCFMTLRLL